MVFNSLQYFLFLPGVFLLFYFTADRWRWLVLLLASVSFYAVLRVPYLLLALALVTVTTYFSGISLAKHEDSGRRKALFWGGVAANLLVLIGLKYLPFLTKNLNTLLSGLSWDFALPQSRILVSIGVSYYVFQAISYLTDIYLEIEKPEKHFGHFALYMSFFPKLLQGPIERAGDLLPQLREKFEFNYDNMRFGLLMFAWGLFKKVVVADRLALYVDHVYGDVHSYSGLPLIIATYIYAIQIYCDFSGYTDMALGTARIFNMRLTPNFNSPYLATSIADFWRRWHISFSRWILDYIFKPLQMQLRDRRSMGTALALVVTFLVSGIWHGAGWCFIVWGLLHGLYLAASVFYKPYQRKIHKKLGLERMMILTVWQRFLTFNLVCFSWIFFRTYNIKDSLNIVSHLFSGTSGTLAFFLAYGKVEIIVAICSLLIMLIVYLFTRDENNVTRFLNGPIYVRWSAYYSLVVAIILFGKHFAEKQFIYTQF
ncbi:MBOAT family protein [Geobacter sp.]|uniref:MBOAT family O-acyltransferase n=1 Tax=Geobacter sp. TaxID=46610 RepID=UPI0027BA483B|nr:MBOAT family O-acyltransferase [Geobacter sp.]